MFSVNKIGSILLLLAAFWTSPSNASFRNAVQTIALEQCQLERSAHLHYQCDIPAGDLKPGETILRTETIQRVFYPCEVRIQSH